MKKNILVLTTGGTIASGAGKDGLTPTMNGDHLFSSFPGVHENYKLIIYDILHLDSSNIQPEEWSFIAQNIADKFEGYDGIVVTHGTDTMAYTSSILSYMLQGLPIPVVLTGSQLPLTHPLTDAEENLRCALAMASSGIPGIYVAFDRKIILGTRAVKVRTTGFDAFESVNYPYIANINSNGLNVNYEYIPKQKTQTCFPKYNRNQKNPASLGSDVFLIKLTPGLNPRIFDMLLQLNYKGIVIEAFGAGGLHFIHRDLIAPLQKLVDAGIPIIVSSQCLYERSDFSIYQTGQLALKQGVIQAFDMTTEAAVTKLIWALGQTQDLNTIREIFATCYAGEITL